MSWLALVFWLELGFTPVDRFAMYNPQNPFIVTGQQFYSEFNFQAEAFDFFFVGGDIRIFAWRREDVLEFRPNRGAFLVFAGLRFDPFEIGFRHYCTHPIVPYIPADPVGVEWEGGYEEIYLRIGGKID